MLKFEAFHAIIFNNNNFLELMRIKSFHYYSSHFFLYQLHIRLHNYTSHTYSFIMTYITSRDVIIKNIMILLSVTQEHDKV